MVSESKIISDEKELEKVFERKSAERYGHRDRTLLAKMGFQDDDLKTKRHDEMFCKLLDPIVMNRILENLFGKEIVMKIEWDINPEFPIITETGYLVGFIDIMSKFKTTSGQYISLMIEIKTSINNIGELLRQINLYKLYWYDSVNPVIGKRYYNGRLVLDREYNGKFLLIVVSENINEEQKKILKINSTYLVDFKDVV